MGELLLVRHGETEWTLSRRHTGLTDLPLTANGEDQARTLAPLLAGRAIGLALTSPLRRARRTAELAGLGYAQVEPHLHEWDYGGYEGLTTAEIRGRRPDWVLWADGVAAGPEDHPGETPHQVGVRADRVLARIAPQGRVNIERETFPAMVEAGVLFALASDGYWLDVGTPERYLQASADLLAGVRPGAPVRATPVQPAISGG